MLAYDGMFDDEVTDSRRAEPHPAIQDERIRKSARFSHKARNPLPDSVERESYKPCLRWDAADEFDRHYGRMRELVAVPPDGVVVVLAQSRNPELLLQFWASMREYYAMHKRVCELGGPPPMSLMPRGDAQVAGAARVMLGLGEDVEVSIR